MNLNDIKLGTVVKLGIAFGVAKGITTLTMSLVTLCLHEWLDDILIDRHIERLNEKKSEAEKYLN